MKLHGFVQQQIDEINRHKWIESERAGYDLGDHAVFDWVEKHSAGYRRFILEACHESIEYPNGSIAPPMDADATIRCSFSCKRIA